MWLNLDTLEKHDKYKYQSKISWVKIWHAMCFKENSNGWSKWAYKPVCKCYQCFSWYKLNLIHGNQHLTQGRDFTIIPSIFLYENLALFMLTSIHSIQKRNSKTTRWKIVNIRFKAQTDQNTEKLSWYIKKLEGKEKKRCSTEETDWYII